MRTFRVSTGRREQLLDITAQVEKVVDGSSCRSGICIVYCPHTTAAITVNEGADPDVAADMATGLGRLVPDDWPFRHAEGNSDAHLKASLVGPSETLLIDRGRLVLGTWQRVFFCEFDGPRDRSVMVKIVAEKGGD